MNYLLNKYLPQIEFDSYEEFREKFAINVPEDFNFGFDVVDAWADQEPDKRALEYAVLGIGINVARMEFPPELKDIATSIANECGHPVSRSRLIAEISNQLEALYGELESGAFMAESRERSIVIGREVLVLRGSERYRARAIDIDARGRLVVQTPEGVKRLGSGEVSLKLED